MMGFDGDVFPSACTCICWYSDLSRMNFISHSVHEKVDWKLLLSDFEFKPTQKMARNNYQTGMKNFSGRHKISFRITGRYKMMTRRWIVCVNKLQLPVLRQFNFAEFEEQLPKTVQDDFFHRTWRNIWFQQTSAYAWSVPFPLRLSHNSTVLKKYISIRYRLSKLSCLDAPSLCWSFSQAALTLAGIEEWVFERGPNWNVRLENSCRLNTL